MRATDSDREKKKGGGSGTFLGGFFQLFAEKKEREGGCRSGLSRRFVESKLRKDLYPEQQKNPLSQNSRALVNHSPKRTLSHSGFGLQKLSIPYCTVLSPRDEQQQNGKERPLLLLLEKRLLWGRECSLVPTLPSIALPAVKITSPPAVFLPTAPHLLHLSKASKETDWSICLGHPTTAMYCTVWKVSISTSTRKRIFAKRRKKVLLPLCSKLCSHWGFMACSWNLRGG